MTWLFLVLACNPTPVPVDTAPPLEEPLATVDVAIIGGGASGLSAAYEALAAGAEVLVIERRSQVGGAGVHAMNFLAAGTPWQEERGFEDSPAALLAEWEEITGGDATNPMVEAFAEGTMDVIEWLISYGGEVVSVTKSAGAGSTARIHAVQFNHGPHALEVFGEEIAEHVMTATNAVDLVVDAGEVIGVEVVQADDSVGWIQARSVIVATGGFARDDDRVFEAVPALEAFPRHCESWPGMDGNGLVMVEAAGGTLTNLENITLYGHGVTDPNHGSPEAMVIPMLHEGMVVDPQGVRIANEEDFGTVWGGHHFLDHGQLTLIVDNAFWEDLTMMGMGYNYAQAQDGWLSGPEYAALVDVASAEEPAALAAQIGVDAETLAATVLTYNQAFEAGVDAEFGKDLSFLRALDSLPLYALPLVVSTGKSFGGAALAEGGAVLDPSGGVVPGLFAAGEAAGVLGGDHVGRGFSGPITGAYHSGFVAGRGAAAYALEGR